ncbi:MAG TPA: TaqI-like C-terminal specificity domain-containing protein, partial [Thermoanaerobaculia bacterium]|nr:TaqI-like C-terminal specificity domain-containing protein [Thermoanaerobaculia bacterium]
APVPRVAVISRDDVRLDDLDRQVDEEGFELPRGRLGSAPWTPEPDAVQALMAKILKQGKPLVDYAGAKPFRGILTGLNEAFLIDTENRNALIAKDARSAEILKPYLRGQDVFRWRAQPNGLWMILLKSSDDHEWPWSLSEPADAEGIFATTFPALHQYLAQWREQLIARSDQGRFWWELRKCSYYEEFDRPKILWQEIQYAPAYAMDSSGTFANNKVFFIPSEDRYLVSIFNSPLLWWHNWRYLVHLKDEALTPSGYKMEKLPIARPSDQVRQEIENRALRVLVLEDDRLQTRNLLIDWLKVEHEIITPPQRLNGLSLSVEDLIEEVRRGRGKKKPLSAAALKNLREEHARTIAPLAERLREIGRIEVELSDLVCQAYKLTGEEIDLMWQTAPPRMPIINPLMNPAE